MRFSDPEISIGHICPICKDLENYHYEWWPLNYKHDNFSPSIWLTEENYDANSKSEMKSWGGNYYLS